MTAAAALAVAFATYLFVFQLLSTRRDDEADRPVDGEPTGSKLDRIDRNLTRFGQRQENRNRLLGAGNVILALFLLALVVQRANDQDRTAAVRVAACNQARAQSINLIETFASQARAQAENYTDKVAAALKLQQTEEYVAQRRDYIDSAEAAARQDAKEKIRVRDCSEDGIRRYYETNHDADTNVVPSGSSCKSTNDGYCQP